MDTHDILSSSILIVDDAFANCRLLERMLEQGGYTNIRCTTDSREVIHCFREEHPDLVLLDLHMPFMDGYAVMEQLAEIRDRALYLPLLILTADITKEAKNRALALGATDFLTKPVDSEELALRIRNALRSRQALVQHQSQVEVGIQRLNSLRDRLRAARTAEIAAIDPVAQPER